MLRKRAIAPRQQGCRQLNNDFQFFNGESLTPAGATLCTEAVASKCWTIGTPKVWEPVAYYRRLRQI